jgi:hypothetical protein
VEKLRHWSASSASALELAPVMSYNQFLSSSDTYGRGVQVSNQSVCLGGFRNM